MLSRRRILILFVLLIVLATFVPLYFFGRNRSLQEDWPQIRTSPPPPLAEDPVERILSELNTGRRDAVKQEFLHGWNAYKKYAWGYDELNPLGPAGRNWMGAGATIIDAIDTIYIMGLKDEYAEARGWIEKSLNFNNEFTRRSAVSTFETTIRILGGLLSIYGLTNDSLFLQKAEDIGERLLYSFNGGTAMPAASVHLVNRGANGPAGRVSLAEVGTLQLEFIYLAKATKNAEFATKVANVIDELDNQQKINNLYPAHVNNNGQLVTSSRVTPGALADSFFEYLLKMWLLTDKHIPKYKRMYMEAEKGIRDHMVTTSPDGKLLYLAELSDPQHMQKRNMMDHLACFAGGMFALASVEGASTDSSIREEELRIAKELGKTCYEGYKQMPTGIAPEVYTFQHTGIAPRSDAPHYLLRPETLETLFVLWRVTGDNIYREWGWEIFQAVRRHCRHENGYTGIRDVRRVPPHRDDTQQTFFFAETLKYLYLLFSPNDLIPLDKFVFNTEAHPLPIFRDSPFSEWKKYVGSDKFD